MDIPLKQFMCNDCGALSEVLDIDASLPDGWIIITRHTHYCDKCAAKHICEDDSLIN